MSNRRLSLSTVERFPVSALSLVDFPDLSDFSLLLCTSLLATLVFLLALLLGSASTSSTGLSFPFLLTFILTSECMSSTKLSFPLFQSALSPEDLFFDVLVDSRTTTSAEVVVSTTLPLWDFLSAGISFSLAISSSASFDFFAFFLDAFVKSLGVLVFPFFGFSASLSVVASDSTSFPFLLLLISVSLVLIAFLGFFLLDTGSVAASSSLVVFIFSFLVLTSTAGSGVSDTTVLSFLLFFFDVDTSVS